jgi:hypothetical protein
VACAYETCKIYFVSFSERDTELTLHYTRGYQTVRCASPGGDSRFSEKGGTSCLCEGRIYFEQNFGAGWNIYFGRHFAWLNCCTYHVLNTGTGSKLQAAEPDKV